MHATLSFHLYFYAFRRFSKIMKGFSLAKTPGKSRKPPATPGKSRKPPAKPGKSRKDPANLGKH
jgi:hypothetical protein